MKFLADMGISPVTVQFLREQGYDAVHLSDFRLHRLPDPEIIAKARKENRIILTHDLDFGLLMASSKSSLPSVVLFRLADMRPANVNLFMTHILQQHQEPLQEGALLSVNEKQIRVRSLPIHP